MDMEEKIKKYLEEQCKIDSALAEKYNEAKYKESLIRCCIQYIKTGDIIRHTKTGREFKRGGARQQDRREQNAGQGSNKDAGD